MIKEFVAGLKQTFRHLRNFHKRRDPRISIMDEGFFEKVQGKIVTIRYPEEKIPVPEVGRYKLDLFLEDCIGCDKCVRICPVDCIKIDKVRTVEDLGKTANGMPKKFYFPEFRIDLAQCCYCGLCTEVCPTDCLVMTPEYEYSDFDRKNFIVRWSNISYEEARKKEEEWNLQRKTRRKK